MCMISESSDTTPLQFPFPCSKAPRQARNNENRPRLDVQNRVETEQAGIICRGTLSPAYMLSQLFFGMLLAQGKSELAS